MPLVADEPPAQPQGELLQILRGQENTRRPILTHLNADTTWLLSIPYPTSEPRPADRCRYNILIDLWLRGPQVDQAAWFSKQSHVITSSVQYICEIEEQLKQAEVLDWSECGQTEVDRKSITSRIDAVIISHEFTDHCHQATLKEVDPAVPVFATTKAAELIKSWSHFKIVIDMSLFTPHVDWRTTCISPLPSWIGVSRLVTEKDSLYYHSAVIICIGQADSSAEAVIYTPHGVEASALATLDTATPRVQTLAFMHGLHDVSLRFSMQLNLGVYNALKAQKIIKSKYWVGTHDEVKKGGGIVAAFLRRKAHTLAEALSNDAMGLSREDARDVEQLKKEVAFVDLQNGQSLLLV